MEREHFSSSARLNVHEVLNLMVDLGCAGGAAVLAIRYRFVLTRSKQAARVRD